MLVISAAPELPASDPAAVDDESATLETVAVTAHRVANLQPASTFATAVTELRFDPQVNVQSRGLTEGQADVTVRGGLFKNTGFAIGAVAVFDPQTGHYAVELPIDPDMLTAPALATGSEAAMHAFNATVASVSYDYARITAGGGVRAGIGSDALRFASARVSYQGPLAGVDQAGLTLAAAASSGDGTLPYGDHDFKRFAGHFQVAGERGETNLLLGYQDKFYGWPGAYTGFAFLPETDHVKQGLLTLDHRRSAADGWWQIAGAYRWVEDDYDFDRRTVDSGGPGSFEHATRSLSLGARGAHSARGAEWNWSVALVADRLVRSTDLTHGHFNSRSYLALSLAPAWTRPLGTGATLQVTAGLRLDASNRDSDALMPLGRIAWTKAADVGSHTLALDFSRSSQLPGYTALNSRPTGLFGGNPDLGREYANTLTLAYDRFRSAWHVRAAVFTRHDDDLVDWTYLQGAPFARQANPVDVDVAGAELLVEYATERWNLTGAYSFLDKDADYGAAAVDASFYALNFARQRGTLALRYRPVQDLELRFDNEYRLQEDNPLRNSGRRAWLASLSMAWKLPVSSDLQLELVADNLANEDFEEFPGTPAYGRQVSLALGVGW